jgi:hypothetical protein
MAVASATSRPVVRIPVYYAALSNARWAALGSTAGKAVWTSKGSHNLNGIQRNGKNLEVVIIQPLDIDLASVYRGNHFPELRRSQEPDSIIGVGSCVHTVGPAASSKTMVSEGVCLDSGGLRICFS